MSQETHWYDWIVKSGNSFKEIGQDLYNAAEERNRKKLDSVYDFVNYMTLGIPESVENLLESNRENYNKIKGITDIYGIVNWSTMGIPDMVKGAVSPEEPFSKEHWLNSAGVAGTVFGLRGLKAGTKGGSIGES